MNTRKKSMLMLAVGALIIVIAVGYAAASTMLSITGTASMEATWNVAITGIDEGVATGTAYNVSTPSFTGTSATFNLGLKNLGDSMTYNVTITNSGTIDAKLEQLDTRIDTIDNRTKFSVITSGLKKGDVIKAGESKKFQVYIDLPEYTDVIISTDPIKFKVLASITFKQNDKKATYANYNLNDRIMLTDGSIWRVLTESSSDDDTVKIIKEDGLSNSNLTATNTLTEYNDYLNSTYKNTLSENIKENIVGNITLPKLANITSGSIYNLVCDRDAMETDYITIPYSNTSDGTISNFLLSIAAIDDNYTDRNILWTKNSEVGHDGSDYQYHISNMVVYIDDISNLEEKNSSSSSCSKEFNSQIITSFGVHKDISDSTFMIESYDGTNGNIHPVMTVKKSAIK